MPRPLRFEAPDTWYHVMNRGNARQIVYQNEFDYVMFLTKLAASCQKYAVELHAYVLMPNHFHLFVHTLEANLSRFMHQFLTTFTVNYNRIYDRVGHLFQGRFKALVVDRSDYGLEVTRYIHLNPVRKQSVNGISNEEKLTFLKKYKWSSYPAYIGISTEPSYLYTNNILEQFGDDPDKQRQEYHNYVKQGMISGEDQELMDNVIFQTFLGADTYIDSIKADILKKDSKCTRTTTKLVTALPVETVLEFLSNELSIPIDAIIQRRSRSNEIRQGAIWLCANVCIGKQTLTDIGRYFGGIKVAGVTRIRDRFAQKLEEHPVLHNKYTKLLQQLRKLRRSDPTKKEVAQA
jgi:REP element-mobilizing transposase RayT